MEVSLKTYEWWFYVQKIFEHKDTPSVLNYLSVLIGKQILRNL
jgi:hypothetical protein